MNYPTVYIVTLNWNGLKDTIECLESISKLSYPAVTTIVVDNGSNDNQAEVIEQKFPDATVLKQAENLGFCGGCNVGITYAIDNKADFVLLLNNDTLVPEDLIEKLLSGFEQLSDAGAISPVVLEYPETDKIWVSNVAWDAKNAQFQLRKNADVYADLADREPYTTRFTCGCCMLVPANVFFEFGMLDERYFAFYDEAEWCERIRRNGLESYVIPSAFMYHKGSRSSPGLVSTYLITRNRLLWMKENLGFRERLRSFPYLAKDLIWHLSNVVGVSRRKHYSKHHSRVVLKGYQDYFRGKFYKWDASAEPLIFNNFQG